jgi:hypothetical protein
MNQLLFNNTSPNSLVEGFYQKCDELLKSKDLSGSANFNDDSWSFSFSNSCYNNEIVVIDFSEFKSNLKLMNFVSISNKEGEEAKISFVDFVKYLYLEMSKSLSITRKQGSILSVLELLFYFLKSGNFNDINKDNIEDFFNVLLTSDYENDSLIKRLSAPSHSVIFRIFKHKNLVSALGLYKVKGIWSDFSVPEFNGALNRSCETILGMTLSDYVAGGSFDFLGLDVGRYYVDYCAEFFEGFLSYGTAVTRVFQKLDVLKNRFGRSLSVVNSKKVITNVVQGIVPSDLDTKGYKKNYELMLNLFAEEYNKISGRNKLFSLDVIEDIVSELGLEPLMFDTHEFCRSMLYAEYFDSSLKSKEEICQEYQGTLADGIGLTVPKFDAICKKHLKNSTVSEDTISELCKKYFTKFQSLGHKVTKNSTIPKPIYDAGLVCFMASVGWRVSEYNFSLSSVYLEKNTDIKDSFYTPYRSYVHGHAQKTNGETLLRREITLSTNILIHQMSELTGTDKVPELPVFTFKDKKIQSLSVYQSRCVKDPFLMFVRNYSLFKVVKKVKSEEITLNQLKHKYGISKAEYIGLIDLIEDLSLENEVLHIGNNLRPSLEKYLSTSPDKESKKVIDIMNLVLSEETKVSIKGSKGNFRTEAIRSIKKELHQGISRPTTHAFRHMWAEAVLRRYRGSAGKFIRANFKHIDERFFMAYIRNKETKAIYDVAKRTTISHIVKKHLNDKDSAFSGGFHRFITRAIKVTNVVTPEEFEGLANRISKERIVDIKSNPWSTCLLRVDTELSAKCSEDGIPQRQNASPSFCLGCVNGDIDVGNFTGIVVFIKSDIEACRNSNLPFFIKKNSMETLRKAIKRVQELDSQQPNKMYKKFIKHLNESIKMALKMKKGE